MLARERVLLDILLRTRRKLTKIQLMKLAFLVRQETDIPSSVAYYDFVPYKYGPFSFNVYRDLARMSEAGLVEEEPPRVLPESKGQVEAEVRKLSVGVKDAVRSVLVRYDELSSDDLVGVVYDRYPWYATRSELRPSKNSARDPEPAVFTVGYEGRSLEAFLDHLIREGMRRLVDVRRTAFSRKYGFSKKTLAKACDNVGIEYVHYPQVGVPKAYREDLSAPGAYAKLFRFYDEEVVPSEEDTINELGALLRETPGAIFCFEADASRCHRSRLAAALADRTGLEIRNL